MAFPTSINAYFESQELTSRSRLLLSPLPSAARRRHQGQCLLDRRKVSPNYRILRWEPSRRHRVSLPAPLPSLSPVYPDASAPLLLFLPQSSRDRSRRKGSHDLYHRRSRQPAFSVREDASSDPQRKSRLGLPVNERSTPPTLLSRLTYSLDP